MSSSSRTAPTRAQTPAVRSISRFIAAQILPSAIGPGALAVLDHAGELLLRSPLPAGPVLWKGKGSHMESDQN